MTVCREFKSVGDLTEWLKDRNWDCGSPEEFSEWLSYYFEQGNTIMVHGELYDYLACMELC